jgi:hypothetical protein
MKKLTVKEMYRYARLNLSAGNFVKISRYTVYIKIKNKTHNKTTKTGLSNDSTDVTRYAQHTYVARN